MREIKEDIEVIEAFCLKYSISFNNTNSHNSTYAIMLEDCDTYLSIKVYLLEKSLSISSFIREFQLFYEEEACCILEPILYTEFERNGYIQLTDEEIWDKIVSPMSMNQINYKNELVRGYHICKNKQYNLAWTFAEEEAYFMDPSVSFEEELYFYECIMRWVL
jgi:hypothetical protein